MITQSKSEFASTTQEFYRLLNRHKKMATYCFAATMVLAVALAFFWPRTYKSESKLFVHVGRETVSLDPTATTGQLIPVSLSTETEVNSVLEMLRSRVLIEKLVDEIRPEAILHPGTTAAAAGDQSPSMLSRIASVVNLDPVSDREKAINCVAKRLDTGIEKKSDVITVSGTAESPELAQRIVAKFVEIYFGEARPHAPHGRLPSLLCRANGTAP